MPHPEPLRFGPYTMLQSIGTGGMGEVFRAWDERLHREVAIKVLHRHGSTPTARERFLREARAASSLNHPNICTVFDMGEQDGTPYLVMELLEGESLRERIGRHIPLSIHQLQAIALQAAGALQAAHQRGIIHRDIKPANLFLAAPHPGQLVHLKVLDFGLATVLRDGPGLADSLTHTGSTVGTVEYMSPEQARGEPSDPRSDLFSLGAVLYELATGDVPFEGATSAIIFAELLSPAPVRSIRTRYPAFEPIVLSLLQKDMGKRIPSATALIEQLQAMPLTDGGTPVPATAQASEAERELPPVVQRLNTAAPLPKAQAVPVSDPRARESRPTPPPGARVTSAMRSTETIVEKNDGTPPTPGQLRLRKLLLPLLIALMAGACYLAYRLLR